MKIQTSSLNLYPPEEVVKRFVYNKWSLDKIEHLTSTTYHALHVFGEDEETRKNIKINTRSNYFGVVLRKVTYISFLSNMQIE